MTTQSKVTDERNSSSGEQAILDAAITLFAEKGFHGASIAAISNLAKSSKPNIYHHFKSKDGLYMAVVKDAAERHTALLDSVAEIPSNFKQRLSGFAGRELENILEHHRSTQLILREALVGGSTRGREIVAQSLAGVFARIVDLVRRGQHELEFRDDVDPTLVAFLVVAANMFYFQAIPCLQFMPIVNFADVPAEYSRSFVDILFNGILREGVDRK